LPASFLSPVSSSGASGFRKSSFGECIAMRFSFPMSVPIFRFACLGSIGMAKLQITCPYTFSR
jgi:hypothetical protein